ncbi:MAG: arnB, partial [Acidimicrobiales bacterium]|nr:arnB [Acidimicrobiales bacterium]
DLADEHGLAVVEDACDALGPTLRGTPTGARADISVTSFALSHIITAAGTGGMVLVDDEALADRCLLLRRWGRRSEVQLFGSSRGTGARFFSSLDDGLEYDNLFIFDEVGWNLEPSELSAAFGLVQLRRLGANLARRRRNAERLGTALGCFPEVPGRACGARPSSSTWRRPASTPAWCGPATCCASPPSRASPTALRPVATRRPTG